MRRLTARQDWFDSGLFKVVTWALLCSYIVTQIISSLSVPLGTFDDSIPLVGADLVSRGRLPQVDFQTVYPPLIYYLLVPGFRLLGKSILVYRLLCAALYGALMIAITRLFWVRARSLRPLVPVMTAAVALTIGFSICDAFWPGSAVALLAIVAYAGILDPPATAARPSIAVVGMLAGITALLRFNFGFYVACVVVTDLLVGELRAVNEAPAKIRFRRILFPLLTFGIPFLLCNVVLYTSIYSGRALFAVVDIVAAAQAATGPLRFVDIPWRQYWLVVWPCSWVFFREILATDRLSGRALLALIPAPILLAVVMGGRSHPAVALAMTALGMMTVLFLYAVVGGFERMEFLFLLYFVFVLHYYLVRADDYHADAVFPILVLVIPFQIAFRSSTAEDGESHRGRGLAFIVLLTVICMGMVNRKRVSIPTPSLFANGLRSLGSATSGDSDADRLAAGDRRSPWLPNFDNHVGMPNGADESKVIDFIRKSTAQDEPLFVGVQDHSRIYANNVRIYWLADRIPGCRFIQLDAGVASRADVQRQIITDLDRNRVNWAILESRAQIDIDDDSFVRKVKPDSRLLDDFLAANFGVVANFGIFSVRQRITTGHFNALPSSQMTHYNR